MTPELLNKLKHLANIAAHLPHDVTLEDEDAAMKALHGELAADTVLQMIALAERTTAPVSLTDAQHPDDIAVDRFAAAMKAKMAVSRAKGRGGWDDESQCTMGTLARMLMEHVAKGDPVDIANFAMMLHQREVAAMENHPCYGGAASKAIKVYSAAAPAPIQQEPVLWIESEPSARLLPLDEIINGMCFTVLYHHKKPQTDNPVWPLYAGAALAGSQVQAVGDAAPISGLPFADLATPIKEFEAKNADQG